MSEQQEFEPYSKQAERICSEVFSLASQTGPARDEDRRRRMIRLNVELLHERMAVMHKQDLIERTQRTIANLERQLQG